MKTFHLSHAFVTSNDHLKFSIFDKLTFETQKNHDLENKREISCDAVLYE